MPLQWKKLSEEIPEEDRMILIGDHNYVDVIRWWNQPKYTYRMKDSLVTYQWVYFNPPEKLS